ncbi:MAG: nitroreductase family protein [Synergistaceae bacterium]|nr:nitroreductase family protein [Synergistaceae bacterium]
MKTLFIAVLIVLSIVSFAFADIELPAPVKEGGIGVYEAFNLRASAKGGSFPSIELNNEELSQVLWAATGLNRDGNGWTVPMAMGTKPYCKIYVSIESGVFLYDWENHMLKEVSVNDIRSKIAGQEYAKTAPCSLIFVTDMEVLRSTYDRDKDLAYHFASVAAGAMTQDIYLAAASLNLGARYIYSIDRAFIHEELKLANEDSAICVMLMGKYAK